KSPLRRRGGGRVETASTRTTHRKPWVPSADEAEGGLKHSRGGLGCRPLGPLRRRGGGRGETARAARSRAGLRGPSADGADGGVKRRPPGPPTGNPGSPPPARRRAG